MAVPQLLMEMYHGMAPFWAELSFLAFFLLGFALLRLDPFAPQRKGKQVVTPDDTTFPSKLRKAIESETTSGNPAAVLKLWRSGSAAAATPPELLKSVAQAFLDTEPGAMAAELAAHIHRNAPALRNARTATALLDVAGRSGQTDAMAELWRTFREELDIAASSSMYEMLLGGYASVGDEAKVEELFAEAQEKGVRLTARGFSLVVKGFLKHGRVDAVLRRLLQMQREGLAVPPFAVAQLLRAACDAGRLAEVFSAVAASLALPPEAASVAAEDACKRGDMAFAKCVEAAFRSGKQALPQGAYDPLLKLAALQGDPHASELFREMQAAGHHVSEGLCVGLLARCAEARFLRFAEELAAFSRARGGMSVALYSALMKVYAYCGMFERACGLYDELRKDGLEPDAMMYGCLMKFAVECGRTDLSRELSEKAPCLDIQNYMSLIRAAGRDKDVDRAFGVLQKLEKAGMGLDVAAHNCVLDVCVSAGDMQRARSLVKQMKEMHGAVDVITYNTLIKGYCQAGDLRGAKELLREMASHGLTPNDVSYNCLINAAVSQGNGNLSEAWETIELMERNGVAVDHYTISIMMKALKKVRNPRDVAKVLALLDSSTVDICSDEVLLNTVLETCIRHRETRRLQAILADYCKGSLRPQVHTYGSLIKACSSLKLVDKCWDLWYEMEELRGMEPNEIVLGCMLDALVTNSKVEEAVTLFAKWKGRVKPNTVIYSTLIKGFANTHQAARAMASWKEMRKIGIGMNTVVYNAVIDAQARTGATDEVSELVQAMEADGCSLDAITYSTIVKGYCVKGDLDKAFEVFRGMQKRGMARDSIIFNTLLDGCTRHSRFDLADAVLEDMERFKVVPSNFTLGILVKMWGRRRCLEKAFEVVEALPRRFGFHANAQVSTCLISACLHNGALERALKVFEELRRSGADAKAYGALIIGCVRNGHLEKAEQFVMEAYGLEGQLGSHAVGLEAEPLEQLLKAFAQRGMAETRGVFLLERLRAAKAPVSSRVFGSACGGGPWSQGAKGGGRKGNCRH